jgi:Na+/proline symporter
MQRMSACRNEKDAVKAMLFFAVWQAVRPWMWAVVALVSIAMFPVMPSGMTDTQAYPLVMGHCLDIGMRGLLITAFAAAFMSTITTQLNWGASYLMQDFYCRFFRPRASDRETVLVSRLMTLVLAGCGIALTPLLGSLTGAWEFLALLMSGTGVVTVLRWFWWRVNAWTELAVLAAGLVCALGNQALLHFVPDLVLFGTPWADWRFELRLALFTSIALLFGAVAMYLTPPVTAEKLKRFHDKVRPGGWWGPIAKEAGDKGGMPSVLGVRSWLDILGGIALCMGVTIGIGYCVLLKPLGAFAGFGLAVLGGWQVAGWLRRETASKR